MYYAVDKQVKTRKPHKCEECNKEIPIGEKCYWFKSVAFREDCGNRWYEMYICNECDKKLREEDI